MDADAAVATPSARSPYLPPTFQAHRQPWVDIAIPVLNEERALPGCVRTLHAYLSGSFPYPWRITIVDNGSTDGTWQLASALAEELPAVYARRLDVRGRGAALKAAWLDSPADIVAYMDVDLSTGLDALLPLIAPLASGHSAIAIGTRLGNGARIHRRLKREVISRCYNFLLRHVMGAGFSDAQCGFKAARADVAKALANRVVDDGFFFDTELLLLAEYNGLRVHEVPVDWIEDVDSRVNIWRTIHADVSGFLRVTREIASGEAKVALPPLSELKPTHPDASVAPHRPRAATLARITTFAVIGIASTALFAVLYLALRHFWAPAVANLAALAVASIVNTEAHRKWTFRRTDGGRLRQHYRAGLLFALYYASTTGAVLGLHAARPGAGPVAEVATIVSASAALTVFRYIALDRWAFSAHRPD
jgi:putative flippase GtrA